MLTCLLASFAYCENWITHPLVLSCSVNSLWPFCRKTDFSKKSCTHVNKKNVTNAIPESDIALFSPAGL